MTITTDLWAWRNGNSKRHIGGNVALAADAGHAFRSGASLPPERAPPTRETAPEAFATRETEVASLRSILPQRLLDQERNAAFTRWHGYRFMSALECTWQFARDYETQFSITYGMRCAMRPEVGSEDFEVLWEMRQAADDMLISYPLYLEISFQPVRRKDPTLFAKPHLAFARHQKGIRWLRLYKKTMAERGAVDFSRAADLPQFHLANDHGLPAQQLFRKKVGASQNVYEAVEQARKYALERRIVPVSDVLARLSDEDRREAVERLRL